MNRLGLWAARFLMIAIGLLLALIPIELYMRATVRFNPPLTECDPLTDYRLIPNRSIIDSNPGEYRVRYTVNRLSMRGGEVEAQKAPDTLRILGLGDSFTFGVGVEDDETFLAIMERALNQNRPEQRVEVLNTGVSGWGNSHELLYLQERGLSLDPDLIVLAFYVGNDPNENLGSNIFRLNDNQILERSPENERNDQCSYSRLTTSPLYRFAADRSALLGWLRTQYLGVQAEYQPLDLETSANSDESETNADQTPFTDSYFYRLTEGILNEINQTGAAADAPVIFLMIPIRWTPDTDPAEVATYTAPWMALCAENNLACLDSTPILLESGLGVRELYFEIDNHWRPIAHEMVGAALAEYIQTGEFLP